MKKAIFATLAAVGLILASALPATAAIYVVAGKVTCGQQKSGVYGAAYHGVVVDLGGVVRIQNRAKTNQIGKAEVRLGDRGGQWGVGGLSTGAGIVDAYDFCW